MMLVTERTMHPAPEAFRSPGGWAKTVEDHAMAFRLARLVGASPWDFIEDPEVIYNRATDVVVCRYSVPLVLPIRGAAT